MQRCYYALVALCLLTTHVTDVCADLIVGWDLSGNGGAPDGQPATDAGLHITGLSIERSDGLEFHEINNTFSAKGWESEAASPPSDDQEYISFGFTVEPGFAVDLDSFLLIRRSSLDKGGSTSKGPGTLGLYYNGDNFTNVIYTFDQSGGGEVSDPIDLSALTGLTGTVEFRIIEIGNTSYDGSTATAENGVFRLVDDPNTGDVRITGTVVSAVPEPSAVLCGVLVCSVLCLNHVRRLRSERQ